MAKDVKKSKTYWQDRVKTILKLELTRQNVTYGELAERLQKIGVKETEPNIRNKLSRGTFSAMFFVQALEALEVRDVRL